MYMKDETIVWNVHKPCHWYNMSIRITRLPRWSRYFYTKIIIITISNLQLVCKCTFVYFLNVLVVFNLQYTLVHNNSMTNYTYVMLIRLQKRELWKGPKDKKLFFIIIFTGEKSSFLEIWPRSLQDFLYRIG